MAQNTNQNWLDLAVHGALIKISIGGGPIMLAILVVKGIKYACNLGSKGGQICLQFQFLIRTIYVCDL